MHDTPLGPLSAFDEKDGEVVLFDEKKIQAHRAGNQLVYSFNNEEKIKDKTKLTKTLSDRQLFARQIQQNIREGVMIVVQCNNQGIISATVLSLGQKRFKVKLRKLSRVSRLKDTLGVQFMTR
uniref:Transposase n=1 Tax=Heterorhabditis bacteriophora TaxID=37862 RepID=A0A1I7X5D3_HETBA